VIPYSYREGHPFHATGAPPSGLVTALILITVILVALAPAAWLVIRARMRDGRRAYRRDMRTAAGDRACACCGGVNTLLRFDSASGDHMCRNRKLCRAVMAYANMLESL
jgi:hypothetical protein